MMVAVVLDSDLQYRVGQVGPSHPASTLIEDVSVDFGAGKARPDE
jgi:hypothetical protein